MSSSFGQRGLKERERRRSNLLARLEGLDALERQPAASQDALRDTLRAKLVDWHGPLSQHVAQARQLLRKVLIGRLIVTPEPGVRESAITGTATLEKFVSGAVLPKGVASPTGLDAFSSRGSVILARAAFRYPGWVSVYGKNAGKFETGEEHMSKVRRAYDVFFQEVRPNSIVWGNGGSIKR